MPAITIPGTSIKYGWQEREKGWGPGMNTNLLVLGVIAKGQIVSRTTNAPPANPDEGDAYIIPADATGTWSGRENEIAAFFSDAWVYIEPVGSPMYVLDEDARVFYDGTAWSASELPQYDFSNQSAAAGNFTSVADADKLLGVDVSDSDTPKNLTLLQLAASQAMATSHVKRVTDLAALRAVTGMQPNQAVEMVTTGRAGLFRWDSSDLSAEVTADTQMGIYVPPTGQDGSAGAWVRAFDGPVVVTPGMFGAQEGAISTTELQAWLDHGGILELDHDYTANAELTKTLDGDLVIRGGGSITNTTSLACLTLENEHYLLTELSSVAAEGDLTINVVSTAGIEAGDICVIKSSKSWDASDIDYIAGEIAIVHKVVGSAVHLYTPTRDSYLLADDVYFYRPYSADISGIRLYGDSAGAAGNQVGLDVRYVYCPTLSRVRAVNFGGTGMRVAYCHSPKLDNCGATSVYSEPGYAYGLSLISCQGPTVVGGSYHAGRHGITHGGTIPCRNSQIIGAEVGSHDGTIALDAHANTDGLIISGGLAESLSLSGRNIIVNGMDVRGYVNYYIPPDDYHPSEFFKMKNCIINATGTAFGSVVRLYDNNNIAAESRVRVFEMTGCTVKNNGNDLDGVFVQAPFTSNTTNIEKIHIGANCRIDITGANDNIPFHVNASSYVSIGEIVICGSEISSEAASTYSVRLPADFSGTLIVSDSTINNSNALGRTIQNLGGSKTILDRLIVNLAAGTTFNGSVSSDVVEATDIQVNGSPGRSAFNFSSAGELLARNIKADDGSDQLTLTPDRVFYERSLGNVVGSGSAAPTAGTWDRGDIVYNAAPSASGFVGWVCTASGTPGTWKTFGSIST